MDYRNNAVMDGQYACIQSLGILESKQLYSMVRSMDSSGGRGILLDGRCDMNTNTWKSAFNTGYDMGRADGIAEMERKPRIYDMRLTI